MFNICLAKYNNLTKDFILYVWNNLSEYQRDMICSNYSNHYIINKYLKNKLTIKQNRIIEKAKYYRVLSRIDDEQSKHRKKYKKFRYTNSMI